MEHIIKIKLRIILALFMMAGLNPSARGQTRSFYSGNIGGERTDYGWTTGGVPFQMILETHQDSISGTYWYSRIGSEIEVEGKWINPDSLVLIALPDSSPKEIFRFGRRNIATEIIQDNDVDTPLFSGTWTSAKKTLPASIEADPVRLPAGVKILTTTYSRTRKKVKFNASMPKVIGLSDTLTEKRIRQVISETIFKEENIFFKDASDGDVEDFDFLLMLANSDIVSFIGSKVWERCGAAHPWEFYVPFTIDLRTGLPLKLADLFQRPETVLKLIKKYDGEVNYDNLAQVKWYLRGSDFVIIHDDDSGLPHAANGSVVRIPYSVFLPYLKPNSLFFKSLFSR